MGTVYACLRNSFVSRETMATFNISINIVLITAKFPFIRLVLKMVINIFVLIC